MYNDVSVSVKHYLLEHNQFTKCPRDPITGLNFDPRWYTGAGLPISEKTYLQDNNVFKTLEDNAPGYNKPQNLPNYDIFAQLQLHQWSRSNIPWKLECESAGLSRDAAHRMFQLRLEHNFHAKIAGSTGLALWITITALVTVSLIGLLFSSRITFAAFYLSRFVLICCLGIIVHHMGQMIVKVRGGLDSMDFYTQAQAKQCMDQYSVFAQERIEADLNRAWRLCADSIVFSVLVLAFTCAEIVLGLCMLQPLEIRMDRVKQNVVDMVKTEWWQFLFIGYFKFN